MGQSPALPLTPLPGGQWGSEQRSPTQSPAGWQPTPTSRSRGAADTRTEGHIQGGLEGGRTHPQGIPWRTDRQPYPRAEDGGPAPTVFTGFFHAHCNKVLRHISCHPSGGYLSNLKDFLEPRPENTEDDWEQPKACEPKRGAERARSQPTLLPPKPAGCPLGRLQPTDTEPHTTHSHVEPGRGSLGPAGCFPLCP